MGSYSPGRQPVELDWVSKLSWRRIQLPRDVSSALFHWSSSSAAISAWRRKNQIRRGKGVCDCGSCLFAAEGVLAQFGLMKQLFRWRQRPLVPFFLPPADFDCLRLSGLGTGIGFVPSASIWLFGAENVLFNLSRTCPKVIHARLFAMPGDFFIHSV